MKQVREGYKMSEIGEIPSEWNVVKLKEVLDLLKDGTHNPPKRTETGIPLLSAENIFNGKINYGLNEKCISLDDYGLMHKNYEIEKGDILMTIVGTIGRVAIVKDNEKFTVQRSVAILKNNKKINNEFLAQFLSSDICKKELDKKSNSTAQAGLYLGELAKINIILPTLKEQEKIASVLSTVDEQIDNVDTLIEKNKELKKGLMQQLLTKGIGHTKFKKTEVGEIPEGWEVRKIGDICDVRGGKRLPKGYQLEDENNGFPYIRVADMYMGGVKLSEIKYVPEEVVEKIKNYKISKDDLFISVAGTLGIVGKVPEELDGANLTENADKLCNIKIDKLYLMKVLQSELVQSIIDSEKTTNAQPKLALTRIKEFLIPVPNNEEQKKIAVILSEFDDEIEEYQNKKEKLEELKKGLMQKLLTGKIRVCKGD
ncbi:MAG: restriction endonuclease subunit S [Clostridium sp.]|uniref:restriction endonuclease subunit S n=1 Tax=Clostridium sp. TaxID=1506 RepID=UPI0025EF3AD5|nr:restriction endonuclease subunit S [Clostridium sp.]MDY6226792.1 restriction endonuclease subunit S [Clostridium sp.]